MPTQHDVSTHYTHGNLTPAIRGGIEALGKTVDSITVDDLAPVDEFHIGGRVASEHFLDQLGFTTETHVLDIGCGLGGAARFVASRYQSGVDGIDLCWAASLRRAGSQLPPGHLQLLRDFFLRRGTAKLIL